MCLASIMEEMKEEGTAPIAIQSELGIDYRDQGPWRSYHLDTSGYTLEGLIADAWIEEIDQDGGGLAYYALADASNEVIDSAEDLIKKVWEKCQQQKKA